MPSTIEQNPEHAARGVFLDLASLSPADLDLQDLEATGVNWTLHQASSRELLTERLRGMQIAVSNKVMLDADTLARADALQLICVAATGVNNVDIDAARAHGIQVRNARGYANASVAEHVFALLLALRRRLSEQTIAAADGRWRDSDYFCVLDHPTRELAGCTLGIIGYGELGRAVARLGECFGMRILLAQRPGGAPREGRLPLPELLAASDVVSLHCPLTEHTRNLIDAATLRHMRPDALLINTARGGIVDETALLQALRQGHLGGAALDVLAEEPPRARNPLLEAQLPNLIITPHVAWASREARQRLVAELAANIRCFLKGDDRNRVD